MLIVGGVTHTYCTNLRSSLISIMGRSSQDQFVIDTLIKILSNELGSDLSIEIERLIKLRLIFMSSARATVVRYLYHAYKADGKTAQISVWEISEQVGMSDANVWRIIKQR